MARYLLYIRMCMVESYSGGEHGGTQHLSLFDRCCEMEADYLAILMFARKIFVLF